MKLEDIYVLLTQGYRSEESIIRILEKNPDLLSEQLNSGETMLHVASEYQCDLLVYYIMNKKPDPEFWFMRSTNGFSAMERAVIKMSDSVLAVMIEAMCAYADPVIVKRGENLMSSSMHYANRFAEEAFKTEFCDSLEQKLSDANFLSSMHRRMDAAINGNVISDMMSLVKQCFFNGEKNNSRSNDFTNDESSGYKKSI